MSDLKKLEKQLDRAKEALAARRAELDAAIEQHTDAVAAYAVAKEKFEHAEAMETALSLRSSGGKGK